MSSGKRTLAPKRNCGEGGQAPSLRQYKNSTNNGGSIPSKLELEEMILDSLKIIAWVTAFAFALMLKGMALLEFTNFVQRRREIVGRRFLIRDFLSDFLLMLLLSLRLLPWGFSLLATFCPNDADKLVNLDIPLWAHIGISLLGAVLSLFARVGEVCKTLSRKQ